MLFSPAASIIWASVLAIIVCSSVIVTTFWSERLNSWRIDYIRTSMLFNRLLIRRQIICWRRYSFFPILIWVLAPVCKNFPSDSLVNVENLFIIGLN